MNNLLILILMLVIVFEAINIRSKCTKKKLNKYSEEISTEIKKNGLDKYYESLSTE